MSASHSNPINLIGLLGIASVAGIAISAVDNFTFGGEISPIVIVALLLTAAASLGLRWGIRCWPSLIAVWFWLPAVHLAKHILRFPDTLHPNTCSSIAALAAFSLTVCSVGFFTGVALRAISSAPNEPSRR